MGLPTSWCLLSIIHLWWMDEVRRVDPAGALRKKHRNSICGDDAKLGTNTKGAKRYKEVVRQSGGLPSEGKHFESYVKAREGGIVRGVFLERLFEYVVVGGTVQSGHRFAAIPVKGVTSKSLPREFVGDVPIRCESIGLIQIMSLDAIAG
jgi:hypothetical protein